jgi:hypothetical protein
MASTSRNDVLARYGNWYRGDDDLFAHCFILRRGQCAILFQGVQPVMVKLFQASSARQRQLLAMLKQPITSTWPLASYQSFNFVVDPEGPDASEIAVFGSRPGGNPGGDYYAAPPDSEIGQLVKAIARID